MIMKKKMIFFIAALSLLLIIGTLVAGAAGDPGSDSDPIVTKSYVDSKISELKSSLGSGSSGSGASTGATYAVVQMTKGQTLMGGEGTELVLRAGAATAIDNGSNGVSDMTSGTDLMSGNSVSPNHLLLVPRNDGRGIRAVTDIYVMVRGTYKIQ